MSVAHSSLLTYYNAALNKPPFQSSVWAGHVASRANVGVYETAAISLHETNPWWAVDLGGPTTIYRVDFTNRGDGWGM